MEIREELVEGDIVVVVVVGRLDPVTASQLEPPLLAAAEPPTRGLVLDLGGVDYVSSAGLRVLLMAGKRLHERRAFFVDYLNQQLPTPPPNLPRADAERKQALGILDELIASRNGPCFSAPRLKCLPSPYPESQTM